MNTQGDFSHRHFVGEPNDVMEGFTVDRIECVGLRIRHLQGGYFFEQPSEQLKFISLFIGYFFDQLGGQKFFGNPLIDYIFFGIDGYFHPGF